MIRVGRKLPGTSSICVVEERTINVPPSIRTFIRIGFILVIAVRNWTPLLSPQTSASAQCAFFLRIFSISLCASRYASTTMQLLPYRKHLTLLELQHFSVQSSNVISFQVASAHAQGCRWEIGCLWSTTKEFAQEEEDFPWRSYWTSTFHPGKIQSAQEVNHLCMFAMYGPKSECLRRKDLLLKTRHSTFCHQYQFVSWWINKQ